MRAPSAAALLDLWERGLSQSLPARTLALLAAACPESSEEQLAALPVGRRDATLMQLRDALFGPRVTIVTPCPSCGESLESAFVLADIALGAETSADEVLGVELDGYRAAFRLPVSGDLLALAEMPPTGAPRQALLARCLIDIRDTGGAPCAAAALPESVGAAIAARMAAADPQADVELELACPACEHRWRAMFDIAGFLWRELHAWAQRTLRDVHRLARAYGWREADVLALSPTRRQIYLELSRQ